MINAIWKAPCDRINPTAIVYPSKSMTLRTCISVAGTLGEGTARARPRAGGRGEAPAPGQPGGQGAAPSPPVTGRLLAHRAEHDKDISHPLNLITGLLNNRVA